jgi:hypothetical protein
MKFGLVVLFFGFVSSSSGQFLSDSVILQKSKASALAVYDRAMEGNLHIYNGSEYTPYQSLSGEHPFFLTSEWTSGNILYDGEWFENVPMLYDLEKGLIIISYYFKGIKMQLSSDRVQEFTLHDHWFINLKQTFDSLEMKAGFYDVLYKGKTSVVTKRTKKYFEHMSGTDLTQGFKETGQHYLLTHGKYHKVSTKSGVLSLLTDKKKDLKIYIRKNRLFVSEREASIARVAQYYDSLKP